MKNNQTKLLRVLLILIACLFEGAVLIILLYNAGRNGMPTGPGLWLLLLLPAFLLSLLLLYTGGRRTEDSGHGHGTFTVTVSLLLLLTTVGCSAGVLFNALRQGDLTVPAPTSDSWLMMWKGNKPPVFVPPLSPGDMTGTEPSDGTSEDGTGGLEDPPEPSVAPMLDTTGRIGAGMGDSVGGAGPEIPVFRLTASESGCMYLQVKSFGNYTGSAWTDAEPSPQAAGTLSPRALMAHTLMNTGDCSREATLYLEQLQGDFAVPYYYFGTDAACYVGDTQVFGGSDTAYKLVYRTPTDGWYERKPAVGDAEIGHRDRAYKTYLSLEGTDPALQSFLQTVITENQLTVPPTATPQERLELIQKAADWVKNAAVYDLYYDRDMDNSADIELAFLTVYRKGICSHFASAGTLLLRAMGLPARYTVGYVAAVEADTPGIVTTAGAHAWVEVYLDGFGWLPVEVTGSTQDGEGLTAGIPGGDEPGDGSGDGTGDGTGGGSGDEPGDEPGDESQGDEYPDMFSIIKLTPKLTEKAYQKGRVVQPVQELSGFDPLALLGFTYTCSVVGSANEMGYTPTEIAALTIYDKDGLDVTNQLHPQIGPGAIHLYYDTICAISSNITKTYDGQAVAVREKQCMNTAGCLLEGHSIRYVTQPLSGEVGIRPVLFEIVIEDKEGRDMTDLYRIERTFGVLTVTAPLIRLRAADASKHYDGTPLVCSTYKIVGGSLRAGDVLEACPVIGSQTDIGRSENIIDLAGIRIVNGAGEDVTLCYRIETENGTLRVMP